MSVAIKERPLICTAEEVRGLLDGSTTQLRRVVKGAPTSHIQSAYIGRSLDAYERLGVWINCRGPASLACSEHNYSTFVPCPWEVGA